MLDFTELPPDGVQFEQLIRELCGRTGFEVHWTGVGPDNGRDLVVIERANGSLANFERTWLVSCKHFAGSGKSVGIDDIKDVTDACRAIKATGFLLACSTQPSSTVVTRLAEIAKRTEIVTRYWDAIELEKRTDTPETFPLISMFFPKSSKNRPWRIYNTQAPSFWAANYKDYFLYLSSRISNTFPSLKEVELIVERLESISLPKGKDWERHYIRPRAVYFDNKHEQFTVFADYIYPRKAKVKPLPPKQLNEVLKDGEGLHAEDGAQWYLTHWDIHYEASNQVSDRFHLDDKADYEPYLHNFRIGTPRHGSTVRDMTDPSLFFSLED